MIISIGGSHGSGKSTVAQKLAAKLNWPRYYMGGLRREAAKKRGMTLAEYNKLGETDPKTDLEVDEFQKKLGQEKDTFIIEGRTSWHFIPHSLKIYLDVNDDEASRRIFADLKKKNRAQERNEDSNLNTLASVAKSLKVRQKSDIKRYKQYFGINPYLKKNYDFYLDTTDLSLNQVFRAVYKYVKLNIDKR